MKIEINVNGQAAAAMAAQLGAIAGPNLIAAIRGGLHTALDAAANSVMENARDKGMRSPTGTLLTEVEGWLDSGDEASGRVGVRETSMASHYAWLLGAQPLTIVAKMKRALTIPFADNFAGRGGKGRATPEFATYALLKARFKDRVFTSPWGWVGVAPGRGRRSESPKWYFLLRGSVSPKPFNALVPGVEAAIPEMTQTIQRRVDDLLKGVK